MSGLLGASGGGGGGGGSVTLASIFSALGGENAVTAFATGGQTNATALSSTVALHRISVCATAADSVKLPAATVGQIHYVFNAGVAACQVFGQATETINGVASATGISQDIGMGVWYECTVAGAWTTTPVSVITGTVVMGTSQLVQGTTAALRNILGNNTGIALVTGGFFGWSGSATDAGGAKDTAMGRLAAGSAAMTTGRWSVKQGAAIASANDVTLGSDGNRFQITGTTQINRILNTGFQGGSIITLHFQGAVTVTHNTASGSSFQGIMLAGAVSFVASALDQLTLQYDSTDAKWYEIARTVI